MSREEDFPLGTEHSPDEVRPMTLCEFCVLQESDGRCKNGRTIPKKMRCVDFTPVIDRFCSPTEYAGPEQLRQMALFFGLAGKELKRVLALGDAFASSRRSADVTKELPRP
ncbi:MAG: hypothetical protein ABI882_09665 [Acidobacteriota bacterium]